MILDKEFDKILWLILKADRNNRQMIIDFIKSIPNPILDKLNKSIEIYSKYKKDSSIFVDELDLIGSYETSNRLLYWYEIDSCFGSLEIGYSVFTGKNYEETFALKLELGCELNKDNKDEYLGKIRYNITDKNCDEMKYNLIRKPVGAFVIYSLDDRNNKEKNRINIVDLNNMPDEMFMSDFDTRDNINNVLCKKLVFKNVLRK